jgi:hypothetical protein
MNDELVTIATFGNSIEAGIAKAALQVEGIHAAIAGEDPGGALAFMTSSIGVKLLVRREDMKAALQVLEDHDSALEEGEAVPAAEEQTPDDDHPALGEELAGDDEPEIELTLREQHASRAFFSAILGLLFCPLQAYTFWLLAKVCFSDERLAAPQRRGAWVAAVIVFPYVALCLWTIKQILLYP